MRQSKPPLNGLYWRELKNKQKENCQNGHPISEGLFLMKKRLQYQGGVQQQDRLIKDKRKTLDHAVLYSYQGAVIKKYYSISIPSMEDIEEKEIRALINPNKLKPDYDDKILSVGFEYGFQCGDIFEWCNTGTHWLIYLQDLTELAYFKGDIRKCSYEIEWMNDDGIVKKTYAAVSGPTETRINYLQKYGNSYDIPNYSLTVYIPKNLDTLKYFKRYSKFYLSDGLNNVCWRIEAVDSFSMPGVIQFTAVEYYANDAVDNVEEGIANMNKIVEEQVKERKTKELNYIDGETFVKPKTTNVYTFRGASRGGKGTWSVDDRYPVILKPYTNDKNQQVVEIKWDNMYSGQFDLTYTAEDKSIYTKTIVVESLF